MNGTNDGAQRKGAWRRSKFLYSVTLTYAPKLNNDLLLNIALQPFFCKAYVMRF
jgi:hypothetical protein